MGPRSAPVSGGSYADGSQDRPRDDQTVASRRLVERQCFFIRLRRLCEGRHSVSSVVRDLVVKVLEESRPDLRHVCATLAVPRWRGSSRFPPLPRCGPSRRGFSLPASLLLDGPRDRAGAATFRTGGGQNPGAAGKQSRGNPCRLLTNRLRQPDAGLLQVSYWTIGIPQP